MWFLFDGEMRGSSLEEERSWKLPLLKRKLLAPCHGVGICHFCKMLSDTGKLLAVPSGHAMTLFVLRPSHTYACVGYTLQIDLAQYCSTFMLLCSHVSGSKLQFACSSSFTL